MAAKLNVCIVVERCFWPGFRHNGPATSARLTGKP
jgi:hypothetical protein